MKKNCIYDDDDDDDYENENENFIFKYVLKWIIIIIIVTIIFILINNIFYKQSNILTTNEINTIIKKENYTNYKIPQPLQWTDNNFLKKLNDKETESINKILIDAYKIN